MAQSKALAYAQLLRLSNAPTAAADVLMGLAVATGGVLPSAVASGALFASSLLTYHGGMALNDALDAQADAELRPTRPIPSGRVSRVAAFRLAVVMLTLGLMSASYAAWALGTITPAAISAALVLMVVVYNGPLKKTFAAPFVMGLCRALNGLLGMSPALTLGSAQAVAPGVLLFVAGLTLIAQEEAQSPRRRRLALGAGVSMGGILWLAAAPWVMDVGLSPVATPLAWWLLWGVISLMIGRHYVAALLQPRPVVVQRAVGGALQGLILINTALAAGYVGGYWGLAVLVLLPVTQLLARSIPQT